MRDGRLIDLLTAATVGTYLLLALGAASAGTGSTCGTWPLCSRPLGLEQLTALGHRLAAAGAGLLVLAAAVVAYRTESDWRLRTLLAGALLGFAAQVGVGALVAGGVRGVGDASALGSVHLGLGVAVFALLVTALVLALEERSLVARTPGERSGDPRRVGDDPGPCAADDASVGGVGHAGGSERTTAREWRATASAYLRLTKPRLQWLLCLLAVGGMSLAAIAGTPPTGVEVVATLAAGAMAVGASGVANHVVERDRDRRMDRTADRPLATDRVSVRGATALCLGLAVGSLGLAVATLSWLVAGLLAAAMGYYAVVYTLLLKPNTRWSTVIGGGAGALPAVVGWAAATGDVGWPALALAGVVVLWTPAHFYNLGLAYREDYASGGFPLVPVLESEATTRRRIVAYLAATLLAASALGAVADLGTVYAFATVGGGALFLRAVVATYADRSPTALLRAFHASNAFLGVLLVAIVLEAVLA